MNIYVVFDPLTGVIEGQFMGKADYKNTLIQRIRARSGEHMSVTVGSEWLDDTSLFEVKKGKVRQKSPEAKEEIATDRLKEAVRIQRNILLTNSDWTQLPDTSVNREAWQEYRNKLKDVPQQSGFPHDVVWPEKPA